MPNTKFKKQPEKKIKIPSIAIVSNDARFSRMIELEFADRGYNCKNFNISNHLNGRDNFYFSDILNYCAVSECGLIVVIPDNLEKYEGSYGEFIDLVKKVLNLHIILICGKKMTGTFRHNILEKNNVIAVRRPFDTEQFLKEIRSFLIKHNKIKIEHEKIVSAGDLTIDEISRTAQYKNERLPLTKKEFDLLLFLARHKGEALDRKEIFANVWGTEHIGNTNAVDVFINHLRSKIDQKYHVNFINAVRGVGYMMKNR
jgi:DNA-binding response OmpR family regulator